MTWKALCVLRLGMRRLSGMVKSQCAEVTPSSVFQIDGSAGVDEAHISSRVK
jgi:hypothetical protein